MNGGLSKTVPPPRNNHNVRFFIVSIQLKTRASLDYFTQYKNVAIMGG